MPTDPRDAVRAAAADLLRLLEAVPDVPPVRVAHASGRLACLVQVWAADRRMPALLDDAQPGPAPPRPAGRRAGCREDILRLVRDRGRPLTRKVIVKLLRDARAGHGLGTVAKALAELTRGGQLVNPKDKRGYRLPGWTAAGPAPGLFG